MRCKTLGQYEYVRAIRGHELTFAVGPAGTGKTYLAMALAVVALKNKEVAKAVPLDRLLVETDSPYLTPQPFRGKRNEPAHVRLVAEEIANLRDISLAELAAATTANVRRLFNIP